MQLTQLSTIYGHLSKKKEQGSLTAREKILLDELRYIDDYFKTNDREIIMESFASPDGYCPECGKKY